MDKSEDHGTNLDSESISVMNSVVHALANMSTFGHLTTESFEDNAVTMEIVNKDLSKLCHDQKNTEQCWAFSGTSMVRQIWTRFFSTKIP